MPAPPPPPSRAHTHTPSSFPIDWRDVGQCARALPPSCTITDAELSALEGLTETAERALDQIVRLRAFSGASLLGTWVGTSVPGTPPAQKKQG